MRVTQNMFDRNLLYGMAQGLDRLARLNEQLSSGQRVNTVSDDVPASGRILELQRENERLNSYLENIYLINGTLCVATSALERVSETLARVRELAVQAATETYTTANRQVMAEGVDALLSTLLSLANVQSNGKYVFAGEDMGTAPFSATTDISGCITAVAYQGQPIPTEAAVGPRTDSQVNLVGSTVFQQDADVFSSVIALRDAIRAGDRDEINRLLGEVNASHDHIRQGLGRLGERQNQLNFMRASLEQLKGLNDQTLTDKQGADVAELSVQFNSTMALLQMIMKAAAEARRPSIFDFL